MNTGDRVTVLRPNLWDGESGTIKIVHTLRGELTHYTVRADRNFDIHARQEELKPL